MASASAGSPRHVPPARPARRRAVPADAAGRAARRDPRRDRARRLRRALPAALGARGALRPAVPARRAEQPAPDGQARGAARARSSTATGELLVDNRPSTAVQLWPADLPGQVVLAAPRAAPALAGARRAGRGDAARRSPAREGDPLTPVTVKEKRAPRRRSTTSTSTRDKFPGLRIADSLRPHVPARARSPRSSSATSPRSRRSSSSGKPAGIAAGDKVGQTGHRGRVRRLPPRRAGRAAAARRLARHAARPADAVASCRGRATRCASRSTSGCRRPRSEALAYGIQRARDSNCYGCWDANGGAIVALDPHDGSVLALASSPTYQPERLRGPRDDEGARRAGADAGHRAREELPRAQPGARRRLPAGLDVQAGHRDRRDAGAPRRRRTTLLPCTGTYTVAGRHGRTSLQELGPVRQPGRWICRRRSRTRATRTSTSSATTSTTLPPERGHPLQAWASRFGFGRPTGHRRRPRVERPPADARVAAEALQDRARQAVEAGRLDPARDRPEGPARDADADGALLRADRERRQARDAAPAPRRPADGDRAARRRIRRLRAAQQINVDPAALDVVRRGLYEATHASFGTSSAVFGSFPVAIAGKTGTAEKAVDSGRRHRAPVQPVVVVRLRAVRQADARRLRADRERRPRRHGRGARRAEGVRAVLPREGARARRPIRLSGD